MTIVGLSLHETAVYTLLLNHKLKEAKGQADLLARTDLLTGLKNRRAFFEVGEALLDNAHGHPFSLVMLDIDKFKLINDTYGHATGDEVIKSGRYGYARYGPGIGCRHRYI